MGGYGDSESGSGGDGGGEGGTLKTEKDGERQQISEAVRQSCNGPTRVRLFRVHPYQPRPQRPGR